MEHTIPNFRTGMRHEVASQPIVRDPILDDPRFQALVRSRRVGAWSLTLLMLIVYFSFILTLGFWPSLLGRPIYQGLPCTWGIPIGFGMFAFTFCLVAVYVAYANTTYDRLIGQIKQGDAQ
jgi:uncharacterized membrane protein (DUF485 family)